MYLAKYIVVQTLNGWYPEYNLLLLRLLSAICIMRMLINFRYIVQPYSGRPAKYQTCRYD